MAALTSVGTHVGVWSSGECSATVTNTLAAVLDGRLPAKQLQSAQDCPVDEQHTVSAAWSYFNALQSAGLADGALQRRHQQQDITCRSMLLLCCGSTSVYQYNVSSAKYGARFSSLGP